MTIWQTTDLPLAAALMAKGFRLVDMDKTEKKAKFLFEESAFLLSSVNSYWDNQLYVDAKTMAEQTRTLKSRYYQE